MSFTRRLATLTALGLASAGLVGVSTVSASAAEGGTLRWGMSTYLDEHLGSQTFTDGATESEDGLVTFVDGVGDEGAMQFAGSARYAFAVGGVEYYSYTFSDPTVTVADGVGTIAADVAWTAPSGPGSVADITLTTFSTEDDWSDGSLSATPDWLGVAPPDAYGAGKPVGGASWAVDFVNALPSTLQGTFYGSSPDADSDLRKAPAAFTASSAGAAPADPAIDVATAYADKKVTFDVAGSGFSAVTNPGDMGVYVALAPAARFPETDDFEDQDQLVDAEWVTPEQMTDGSFEVTLDPANAHLVRGKKYAVYTWQAHGHSNPTQDTKTPVSLTWSKIGKATKLKVSKVGKAPQALKVNVAGTKAAAGKVVVKLKKGKATKTARSTLKKGSTKVKLPRLGAGSWKATVRYTPADAVFRPSTKKVSFRVR
ncbi:MAG: hypothetical protein WBP61_08705 [Nocardioides sp.]